MPNCCADSGSALEREVEGDVGGDSYSDVEDGLHEDDAAARTYKPGRALS